MSIDSITITAFAGKTDTGQSLSEVECGKVMSLPIAEFAEQGHKRAAWLRSSTGRLYQGHFQSFARLYIFYVSASKMKCPKLEAIEV